MVGRSITDIILQRLSFYGIDPATVDGNSVAEVGSTVVTIFGEPDTLPVTVWPHWPGPNPYGNLGLGGSVPVSTGGFNISIPTGSIGIVASMYVERSKLGDLVNKAANSRSKGNIVVNPMGLDSPAGHLVTVFVGSVRIKASERKSLL